MKKARQIKEKVNETIMNQALIEVEAAELCEDQTEKYKHLRAASNYLELCEDYKKQDRERIDLVAKIVTIGSTVGATVLSICSFISRERMFHEVMKFEQDGTVSAMTSRTFLQNIFKQI